MALRAPDLLIAALLCSACGGPAGEARAPSGRAAGSGSRAAAAAAAAWDAAAPGLEVAHLEAPRGSAAEGAEVTVVRIDPARYRFSLLSAKLEGRDPPPTIDQWVEQHGVAGAINASMYQADNLTALGFMRDGTRVNNNGWTRDKAVFVAEPLKPGLPHARLLDRTCDDAAGIARRYRLVVQSIRMLDCGGRNVWAEQDRRWSAACVGTDSAGHVLLVHCRRPVSTHALVDALLALPLGLKRLMYVEGGPQAALYVRVGGRTVVSEVGRPAEGGLLAEAARVFVPLPNALAFSPR
jgi:phosphodiester glycosidase